MYGAILGDIIGCPYEFDQGNKSKDFPYSCFCAYSVNFIISAEIFRTYMRRRLP